MELGETRLESEAMEFELEFGLQWRERRCNICALRFIVTNVQGGEDQDETGSGENGIREGKKGQMRETL